MKLPTEDSPSIEVDLLIVTISKRWADNDDYIGFLRSNESDS